MGHKEQSELTSEIKDAQSQVEIGGTYFHYKHPDQFYNVLAIGFIEETEAISIIYQAKYGESIVWVRPLEDFTAKVQLNDGKEVDRFTKVI